MGSYIRVLEFLLPMDNSIQNIVKNYPIESIIAWTNLYENDIPVSIYIKNLRISQFIKYFYTTISLGNHDVVKINQVDNRNVMMEKYTNYGVFTQSLKLDGDYKGKNYVPSLLENSRLHVRKLVISAKKISSAEEFNRTVQSLEIPVTLIKYICINPRSL